MRFTYIACLDIIKEPNNHTQLKKEDIFHWKYLLTPRWQVISGSEYLFCLHFHIVVDRGTFFYARVPLFKPGFFLESMLDGNWLTLGARDNFFRHQSPVIVCLIKKSLLLFFFVVRKGDDGRVKVLFNMQRVVEVLLNGIDAVFCVFDVMGRRLIWILMGRFSQWD